MSKEIRNKPHRFITKLYNPKPDYKEPELQLWAPDIDTLAMKTEKYKLIHCCNDLRKLKFYSSELQSGTFVVELYTDNIEHMLRDPDQDGWNCSSKKIYVQNGYVYDLLTGFKEKIEHTCYAGFYTKHIFRMIPTKTMLDRINPIDEHKSIQVLQID